MEKTEVIIAHGHKLVRSTHRTTFEVTKEKELTIKGDCIIAVGSNKAAADLSRDFKEAARNPDAEMMITIEAGSEKETVKAAGDPRLSFTHPSDIVVRKSSYVCDRTLAVKADKSAAELSRGLVERLKNPSQPVKIILTVKVPAQ
ncbi:MAG: DUF371 domain-containing protein [Candidatus Bathyarchaeota archaeon]|nr:DUF371 domain-containing protein [Candidatus Bathyarchaeota archaeon]